MIDFIPPSVLVTIGPVPIHFYGLAYAIGLAATYWVMNHEAHRRGHDTDLLGNGLIVVAIAAIIGGRAYHVIDQFAYYKDHVAQAFLPVDAAGNFVGFGGLGVYGGIITGTLAGFMYVRRHGISFWTWADIVAPGLFTMQAIARWGNFFNQELYGPPTNLPWGIAIQCSHRIVQYACPAGSDPNATLGQHFQPLFLYESLSGFLGLLALLFLARRYGRRLRTGDLLAVFFIWYGVVRFALETLRADNWTFFGVPMAQIFSTIFILLGIAIIIVRRVSGAPTLLVVDSAAKVAALEPVGVPGEGGDAGEEAADAADADDLAGGTDGDVESAADDEAPDPDDDLTGLLAPQVEDAPDAAEPSTPEAAESVPTSPDAPATPPTPPPAPPPSNEPPATPAPIPPPAAPPSNEPPAPPAAPAPTATPAPPTSNEPPATPATPPSNEPAPPATPDAKPPET
jgi:phosphatidylglycerol:prolipoprotein diacylglycerol transferase